MAKNPSNPKIPRYPPPPRVSGIRHDSGPQHKSKNPPVVKAPVTVAKKPK